MGWRISMALRTPVKKLPLQNVQEWSSHISSTVYIMKPVDRISSSFLLPLTVSLDVRCLPTYMSTSLNAGKQVVVSKTPVKQRAAHRTEDSLIFETSSVFLSTVGKIHDIGVNPIQASFGGWISRACVLSAS